MPVLAAAALAAGCSRVQPALGKVETAAAKQLISPEQENQIGQQVRQELVQQQKVKFLEDPMVVRYVNGVAEKILVQARRDRPEVKWQITVIDDPKTVNAFATPGGYLYIYSGLLLAATNEAELAGILAHESGHVVGRHSARSMVTAYGLEAIAALALGKNPGLASSLAANIAGQGLMLAHSRSEETEADEYGARYTSGAGYDPKGLITFFEKLKAMEGKTPALLAFLSDHPATPDRIAHLQEYIAAQKLGGTYVGTEPLRPVKQELQARYGGQAAPM